MPSREATSEPVGSGASAATPVPTPFDAALEAMLPASIRGIVLRRGQRSGIDARQRRGMLVR